MATDQKRESRQVAVDSGLLKMVQYKLEAGSDREHIEQILLNAGFDADEIKSAIEEAVRQDTTAHQRKVAQNDFLPPLQKKEHADRVETATGASVQESAVADMVHTADAELAHRGLFRGRLRRKDFIIGILFFFGLAYLYFTTIVTYIKYLAPDIWNAIINFVEYDSYGIWLLFIPFIFAPFTIMVLSLITRRLHNLGLPGWIAPMYLLAFVSPFGDFSNYPLWGMHIVLFTLFIVLLAKKGVPGPNKHGNLPRSEGSIFARVLGRDRC